ncbi:MAG: cell division ATP-binding protein FtsE [Chitinivibrionales bacterium]|nr:cell division ATP-binding protein FtsE [Chitinivibrionales bacterium]
MIQFSHVTKQYDDRFTALQDVSFTIDKGEFVFLTGASGAGKTTLLKHIYMEERPTHGQITLLEEQPLTSSNSIQHYDSRRTRDKEIPFLRRKLGIVFQDFRLLQDRNVFENVAFAMRVTGAAERSVKRKVFEVLAQTGLSHKSSYYPSQLSGGEQQRVCIARAIVNDPLVVLADEPTGNLDNEVSLEIVKLLQEINIWGTTVIMSTHDVHIIELYHYRLLRLERGCLVQGGDATKKPKAWGLAA